MLKNYFVTALRVLKRNPSYTAINVFGLSIGIAACLVILMFVVHERSFDTFHENADSTYRIYRTEYRANNPTKRSESTAAPLAREIKESISGVEFVTRFMRDNVSPIEGGTDDEMSMSYVDPDFFRIFDFATSNLSTAIQSPDALVVTDAAVERFFGGNLEVGDSVELLESSESIVRRVVAIIPEPPANSSLRFDIIAPFSGSPFFRANEDRWTAFRPSVYMKLRDGITPDVAEQGLARIVDVHMGEGIASAIEQGWLEDREDAFTYVLQPLGEVHLSSDVDSFNITVSNSRYSNTLLLIAIAILFIACVNFVTQSIGRSDLRRREVQMRKSLGADSSQLVQQFLGESLIITLAATAVAVFVAEMSLPLFNRFAEQQVPDELVLSTEMLLLAGVLVVVCTLMAGLYPAVYLARERFRKAQVARVGGGNYFVRGVVIAQFGISIGMIAGVLVIHSQIRFIDSQDLGFAPEELVLVDMNAGRAIADDVADLYQDQVERIPGVLGVSGSSSSFGDNWSRTVLSRPDASHIVYTIRIDPEFLEATGIDLLSGRALSDERGLDVENSILVNSSFVRTLNLESPVGSYIPELDSVQIVGVVEDFNFLSLREEVPPTVLHMSPSFASESYTMVRFDTARLVDVMSGLEESWTVVAPDEPFVAEFLDDRLSQLYSDERRWQRIIVFSAALAIILSCLGLFGIASMNANRRMKEIGIRKVLGSSIPEIVRLLSTDFAMIVVIAFTVAAPVAWFLLNRWLDTFAYRMTLGPTSFVLAGIITLAIALLTVSHQSIRAALRNPVEVLRSE